MRAFSEELDALIHFTRKTLNLLFFMHNYFKWYNRDTKGIIFEYILVGVTTKKKLLSLKGMMC